MSSTTFRDRLADGAGRAYGYLYLVAALLMTCTTKTFWRGHGSEQRKSFAKATREFWSLQESLDGVRHRFLRLSSGTQLHYLEATPPAKNESQPLVVFIHGFPDTSYLFLRYLRSSLATKAQLVALDLPAAGGSDDLDRYGPNEVLNVVAEAIVLLKERYQSRKSSTNAQSDPPCIVVGHDWGGIIAFRLAAETTGLFHHYIAVNTLYPSSVEVTIRFRIAQAKYHISGGKIFSALISLWPIALQLLMSSYVYMMNLEISLVDRLPAMTWFLLDGAHGIAYKQYPKPTVEEVATRLAMACGPGPEESIQAAEDGSAYGPTVHPRSLIKVPGDWDERIKLYSQGLLRQEWTQKKYPGFPSPQTEEPALKTTDKNLQCPVTFFFGLRDIALDHRVMVDGIEDFFCREGRRMRQSRVVRLPNCGHWSLIEKEGEDAIQAELRSVLEGK